MIKSAPLNYASSQRFLQSGYRLLYYVYMLANALCQCTAPMHCANAVHIFYHLLFSSLLSINARYFKMYLIKVLLRSFMFFFIAIECTYRQWPVNKPLSSSLLWSSARDFTAPAVNDSSNSLSAFLLQLNAHHYTTLVDNVLFNALSTSLTLLSTSQCFQVAVAVFTMR